MAPKIRVAVLYGGRSGEHEVSLRSAASVIRNLDSAKYEIVPIGIDKLGRWHLNDIKLLSAAGEVLPMPTDTPEATLPPRPGTLTTPQMNGMNGATALLIAGGGTRRIDVVFPVMHGTFSEDGTIQGLLELADVPYVGCGVLASALGMDKDVAKRLARDAGLPIVPYISVRRGQFKLSEITPRVEKEIGYPCFVKPANSGSSVGVHKVKESNALKPAIEDAFQYDTKILIEKGISAREIEVAVLENPDESGAPLVSVPGEIRPVHEFYSYEAKYLDADGAVLLIPADLETSVVKLVQELGRRVFTTLECEGMARVDLFFDKRTGDLYFNEINTIPGFTSISMYPKMWEASGVSYKDLLSKLIDLAISRHKKKSKLVRDFSQA